MHIHVGSDAGFGIRRTPLIRRTYALASLLLSSSSSPFTVSNMSLQGLISGAECAVPFNPLSQVLKHTEGDRSLQQVGGPGLSDCPFHD